MAESKRGRSLNTDVKREIRQIGSTSKTVSEIAAQLGISRNAVYRWQNRDVTTTRSRRPRTGTASLLTVQRDMICELIRLTRWPKKNLLPLVTRVFSVFGCLGESGQRRLWKEVLGGNPKPPEPNGPDTYYRSHFRVGVVFVAYDRGDEEPICVLVAVEVHSGLLIHRVVEGEPGDAEAFLLDLCHEWPFQAARITIVSNADPNSRGYRGRVLSHIDKKLFLKIRTNFEEQWSPISQPRTGRAPNRIGPQTSFPTVDFELNPCRRRVILLRSGSGKFSVPDAKQTIRKWCAKFNTKVQVRRVTWEVSRDATSALGYLVRLWEGTEINGAVGFNETPDETRRRLRDLAITPIVRYTESRKKVANRHARK